MITTPKLTAYVERKNGEITVTVECPVGIIPDQQSCVEILEKFHRWLESKRYQAI